MQKKNHIAACTLCLLTAATALVSCHHDDDIDDTPQAIKLSSKSVDDAFSYTRAGIYDLNHLKDDSEGFRVYGYKQKGGTVTQVFNGQQHVTWSSTQWTYSPTKFWDKNTDSYHFAAYAPQDAAPVPTPATSTSDAKLTFQNIPQWQDAATGNDYIVATHTDLTSQYVSLAADGLKYTVPLEFHHILAKLVVRAFCKSNALEDSKYCITGVSMGDAKNNPSTGTVPTANRTYEYNYTDSTAANCKFDSAKLSGAGHEALTIAFKDTLTRYVLTDDETDPDTISTALVAPFDITELVNESAQIALTIYYDLWNKNSTTKKWEKYNTDDQVAVVQIPRPDKNAPDYDPTKDFYKFESGKEYTLTISIEKGMISLLIDVGIKPWTPGGSKDTTVYNW